MPVRGIAIVMLDHEKQPVTQQPACVGYLAGLYGSNSVPAGAAITMPVQLLWPSER